jgi:hypothetical protein
VAKTLDRSRSHTGTFGPDSARFPFFQDGLYFGHDGKLIACEHNHATLGHKVGAEVESPRILPLEPADENPGNPEIVAQLNGQSDEDIYIMAINLQDKMLDDGNEAANEYSPSPELRDENIRFIARNTIAEA